MRSVFTMASVAALGAALLAAPLSAQPAPGEAWTAEGQLEDGDSEGDEQHRYDDHRLRLEADRRYRISARSDDFDTLIRLFRAGEDEPVAENDDFNLEEGLNSRITYVPQESGDYVLRVLSFSAEGRGAYTATAEALPPLPPPSTAAAQGLSGTRWHLWEGELGADDPDRDGHHFDDYQLRMRAGETRLISVESVGFDAMVWVLRADEREGEPLDMDDDAGPGYNALLGFRPEDDGDYVVRVTTYGSGSTGAYRLRISEPLTPPPPVEAAGPAEDSGD